MPKRKEVVINSNTYKLGDLIAYTDFEDDFLCKIEDIWKIGFDKENDVAINVKVVYKNNKPVDADHVLFLPKDDHTIRTKEEYFEIMQNKIDALQQELNAIKAKYSKE